MLRLRRDEDGRPLLHPSGAAVRVEDAAGNASWQPLTALPEELPPAEWAEVAALASGTSDTTTTAEAVPPVVSDADLRLLADAGVPVSPQRLPQGATGRGSGASGCTGPNGAANAERRTDAGIDPVVLDARRRQALAAARKAEAAAEEAEAKRELMRRRVYQERAEGGPRRGGDACDAGPDAERLAAARLRRQTMQEERDAAIAEAEAIHARQLQDKLTGRRDKERRGTTGPQLFWVGFAGWVIGALAVAPLRAIMEHQGNPGGAALLGLVVQMVFVWLFLWVRLRRVRAEKEAELAQERRAEYLREREQAGSH